MVDVECGGSAIRDYRQLSSLDRLPENVISLYHDENVEGGQLLYGS